jgi:hypothetical protein
MMASRGFSSARNALPLSNASIFSTFGSEQATKIEADASTEAARIERDQFISGALVGVNTGLSSWTWTALAEQE